MVAELDRTLFVEAGAGSGKTRALVERVVALVDSGVSMENIAAITFTEKAAAELRSRIRERLAQRSGEPRAEEALRQLDAAAVGTLHAFAHRLLSEHPVEAGLPPDVLVLDELRSQIEFESRWQSFLDELLDDTSMTIPLLTLETLGVRPPDIRSLAGCFDQNWDRLGDSSLLPAGRGEDTESPTRTDVDPDRVADSDTTSHNNAVSDSDTTSDSVAERLDVAAHDVLGAVERVESRLKCCRVDDDKLLMPMKSIAAHLDRLRRACSDDDAIEKLEAVVAVQGDCKGLTRGTAANWGGKKAVEEARQSVKNVKELCDGIVQASSRAALGVLAARLAQFSLDAAEQRRRAGRLAFHDLLVQACMLLRHHDHGAEVRAALRDRYQRLLLDEFQDTDPLQIELAMLLACPPHAESSQVRSIEPPAVADADQRLLVGDAQGSAHEEATGESADPGRLFFVGDPKQSIYRFRRADISTYLQVRQRVYDDPHGDIANLSTNFRSASSIIHWVNEVFSRLIVASDDSQPAYEPLRAWRTASEAGPGVAVLGADALDSGGRKIKADGLRTAEAAGVAAAISECMRQGWSVHDEDSGGWREARLSDVAVLIPTRASLSALENAFEAANIAYRAEASSLVYSTREVRDALIALQAIADPTDELALVAALRSPLYGCGDDDLLHWKLALGGRFSLTAGMPDDAPEDHPVAESLRHLRSMMHEARWSDPPRMLDRLLRERGAFETAVVSRRPRDVWRRLRFVVDQARAWADAGGSGLRDYVQWARLQAAESARVTETILPETDDDSVRILTIHASKGLEFPIVMLSGMTGELSRDSVRQTAIFPPDGEPVIRLKAGIETANYEQWRSREAQMDADERLRLLYVASTRARDHLIVSLVRDAGAKSRTGSVVLAEAGAGEIAGVKQLPVGASETAGVTQLAVGSNEAACVAKPAIGSGNGFQDISNTAHPESTPPSDGAVLFSRLADLAPTPHSPAAVTSNPYDGSVPMPARDDWLAELRHAQRAASIPAARSPSSLFKLPEKATDTTDPAKRTTEETEPAQQTIETTDPAQQAADASHQTQQTTETTDPIEQTAEATDQHERAAEATDQHEQQIDPGLRKDDDNERPPWRKGRYGTAVGSAVHAVLQDVDLAHGRNLDSLAKRYAAAEGVSRRLSDVTALARAALGTQVTHEAADADQCWRELFVAAPFGQTLLEGYIDLAYRDSDGRLVVVDWKTDYLEGDDDLDIKMARYRLQGAAYAAALEAVTGETVYRMVFVFLNRDPDRTVEAPIPDLRAAITEAQAVANTPD